MQQFKPVASPSTFGLAGFPSKAKRVSVRSAFFALSRGPALDKSVEISASSHAKYLLMAIPKKLLKSAVKRNRVRRVARESWRSANSNIVESAAGRAFLLKLITPPKDLTHGEFKHALRSDLDKLLQRTSEELSQ